MDSHESPCLLLVECALVLEPLSISRYTLDLFAIVIRDWVASTRVSRIDSVLLDASKELAFLLHHLGLETVVHQVEDLITDAWADQPPHAGTRQSHDSQSHKRVQGDLHDQRLSHARGKQNGTASTAEQAGCDGKEELNAAAAETELEERVPVQV